MKRQESNKYEMGTSTNNERGQRKARMRGEKRGEIIPLIRGEKRGGRGGEQGRTRADIGWKILKSTKLAYVINLQIWPAKAIK